VISFRSPQIKKELKNKKYNKVENPAITTRKMSTTDLLIGMEDERNEVVT